MINNKIQLKWLITLILASILLIASVFYIVNYYFLNKQQDIGLGQFEITTTIPKTSDNKTSKSLESNPIDFKNLQSVNSDIYAWIKIPGTKVNYPIAQSKTSDSYYLTHNYKKQYDPKGTIYSEKLNKTDFNDPNTLLYGHNSYSGEMFRGLYNFKEKSFFDKNKKFYIYMPNKKLTYKIFSAYIYDNRHILHAFDFSNKETFNQYLKDSQNPNSIVKNTRKAELNEDSKIITLSTCEAGQPTLRYLVQGVLIKNEQTKWE